LFTYNDNSYLFDITNGVSIPIPDIFKINDFDKNTPSKWVYTKENVEPHPAAYKELSKSINDDYYAASIVSTRYHRSFDGDYHWSFKMVNLGTFGIVIRYKDN